MKRNENPCFIFCDFNNEFHTMALVRLINEYKQDPMGGGRVLDRNECDQLIRGLADHSSSFVLFLLFEGQLSGLATCFVNYSTFRLAPYINIHDIVISDNFRGKGLGKALLDEITNIASQRGYCKINLEVREDNHRAMALYKSMGFGECKPNMFFWEKILKAT